MKRRVAFVLLPLVGGAIVNVAVAWGFVIACDDAFEERKLSSEAADAIWRHYAPPAWPNASNLRGTEGRGFGRARALLLAEDAAAGPVGPLKPVPRELSVGHFDAGWPFVGLRCTTLHTVTNDVMRSEVRWLWYADVDWFRRKTLPLCPIWPGFAINTLFYGGILWLLFAAPFALRRRVWERRIKRGLCPKCAYPIGASEVCTECGAAIPLSLAAVARR